MTARQDYRALDWISEEIEDSYAKARQSLESYLSDSSDKQKLQVCLAYTHQIHAALKIAQIKSACQMAGEVEVLARALYEGNVKNEEDALQVLLGALTQFPSYINYVQSIRDESMAVLLPVINQIRAVLNKPFVTDKTCFRYDEESVQAATSKLTNRKGVMNLEPLPKLFERLGNALIRIDAEPDDHRIELEATYQAVIEIADNIHVSPQYAVWEAAASLVRNVQLNGGQCNPAVKNILHRLYENANQSMAQGDAYWQLDSDKELLKDILFYLVLTPSEDAEALELMERYGLDNAENKRLNAESLNLGTPDKDTVAAVLGGVKNEITQLKADLEQSIDDGFTAELHDRLIATAKSIASTLNLAKYQTLVEKMDSVLATLDSVDVNDSDISDKLMPAAESAFVVESAVDKLLSGNNRDATEIVVLHEARRGVDRMRQAVTEFIESQWNKDALKVIPGELTEITGAITILSMTQLVDVLHRCEQYVETELLNSDEFAEDASRLEKLADALTAIDCYLESAEKHPHEEAAMLLDSAISALSDEEYVPTLEAAPVLDAAVEIDEDDIPLMTASAVEDGEVSAAKDTELVSAAEDNTHENHKEVEDTATNEQSLEPLVLEDELDDEIVEIFLEEAEEVLATIEENYPAWKASEALGDELNEIRRAFHTLKGSGRMVGAEHVGEAAWSIENMLNRVIDGSVPIDTQRVQLVGEAKDYIPELVENFRQLLTPNTDRLSSLIERAELMAKDASATIAIGVSLKSADTEIAVEEKANVDIEPAAIDSSDLVESSVTDDLTEDVTALSGEASQSSQESESVDELEEFTSELLSSSADEEISVSDEEVSEELSAPLAEDQFDDLDLSVQREEAEADHTEDEQAEEDEGLLEIFASEADMQLEVISDYLTRSADDTSLVPDESLERAFHTLVGGARIANMNDIAATVAPAEILVGQIIQRGHIRPHDRQLIQRNYDWLYLTLSGQTFDDAVTEALVDDLNEAVTEGLSEAPSQTSSLLSESQSTFAGHAILQEWRSSGAAPSELDSVIEGLDNVIENARAAGYMPVKDLAEDMLKAYYQYQEGGLPYEAYLLFDQAHAELEDMLDCLAAGQSVSPATCTSLLQALVEKEISLNEASQELLDSFQSESDSDDDGDSAEDEIIAIFREESVDLMEAVERDVQAWLNDQSNSDYLEGLLRPLHTIKGGARMAGLEAIGELSHNFETLLESARAKKTATNATFFKKVESFLNELSAAFADTSDKSEEQSQKSEDEARTPEMVRVSSELLEKLVNLAGETSIARSRAEEQVNDFVLSLDEVESTIERLRDQLRRLEIETEAQISFRKEQVESEGMEDFDPLEMDRYSQLQQLSKSLMESAYDLKDLKSTLSDKSRDIETLLLQQARINTELQEGLMRTRMVPLSLMVVPRLRRLARQVSGETNKPVTFDVYSVEGELDRSMIDHIMASLEHVLRNAVDHGIESISERRKLGKPDTGTITLNVFREGGEVVIELQDDGKGIDVASVKKKAIATGLMDKKSSLSDSEIIQFIFASGFSTAESVTKISGRGVGMDVVQSDVKAIGGSVEVSSVLKKGTTMRFRLPFTVSMSRALLISAGNERLAVPLDNVEGIVRVSPYELEEFYGKDAPMFEYAGQKYEFQYLGHLINGSKYVANPDMSVHLPVLLVRSGDQLVALQVDKLLGSREIVVKSLGTMFSRLQGVSGATVLGDGSVVIIADLIGMVRATHMYAAAANDEHAAAVRDQITAMVVDDSVTVRKVTTRMLERFGMKVITAKDGVEAMQVLEGIKPDFMLLDIEMPRMDGFEVASRVRRSDDLGEIPIIMITSRTGSKHRDRALSLGVNHYLGKPYQEAVLLKAIENVLGNRIKLSA